MKKVQPKIGVAFGGGGAKGLAQIGILQVFEKYGIKISSIAGTSAGAVIGGTAALGYTSEEILKLAEGGVATKKQQNPEISTFLVKASLKTK